ncbi:MAG TPA: glutamate-5-semialdehyde dehydrogenase [Nitriliruptorales bacterium]|nr:glutamate-5-semialdehyde dehydrogenase [Nitriliruptorales bacterium]
MRTVRETCQAAKHASRGMATLPTAAKDAVLAATADALEARAADLLDANRRDVAAARRAGLTDTLIDRLTLTEGRIRGMAGGLRQVVQLDDPVGEVVAGWTLPNGLEIRRVRVPLGVVAIVYEARPNVTVDAAGLCLKSGNACVLRGSSSAQHSNAALTAIIREQLAEHGLSADAVCLVEDPSRDSVGELLTAQGLVDLLIPRGGPALVQRVIDDSRVPVVIDGAGNCHVYVDAAADLAQALDIAVNAKVSRPSVCNAAETLLVHEAVAGEFLPKVAAELRAAGVELVGDERAREIVDMGQATDDDFATEFLDLKLAVAVVTDLDAAIAHIGRFGTLHTEAVVTQDRAAARRFQREVDAAVVVVNASTRFTDGEQFGFGAEIGISTQKTHARGPMALRELTSVKYLVDGDGHIRR